VEGILMCVAQQTQGLCRELNTEIKKIQLDLEGIGMSVNQRTQNFCEELILRIEGTCNKDAGRSHAAWTQDKTSRS
jgi:hypothetical protein